LHRRSTMQTAASYVWSFTGAPLRVAIDLPVVSAIREAIVSHGNEEIGGLLLGNSSGGATHITSFESVPCEHRRGEAYDLSPIDRSRFARAVASHVRKNGRGAKVVGFFRSHHRLGLYLDEHDFRTIQEFFANADQVVLLVRPEQDGPPSAGFFFWDEGEMHRRESFQPFPLDEEILGQGDYPLEPAVTREMAEPLGAGFAAASTDLAQKAPIRQQASRNLPVPVWLRNPGTWWKTAALVAGIPVGIAFGHYLTRMDAIIVGVPQSHAAYTVANSVPAVVSPDVPLTQSPAAGPPSVTQAVPPVALPAKPSPWDTTPDYRPGSGRPPVGTNHWRTRQDPLEAPLRTNAQSRHPLEAAQFGRVGVGGAATSMASIVPAPIQQTSPIERQPANKANEPLIAEPKQVVAESREPVNLPSVEPEHPVRHVFRPETRPAISLEPLTDGEHIVTKNVRRLGRLVTLGVLGSDAFRPARPIREFAPAVPDAVSQQLKRPVPIAVRITIDRDGRVRGTELLTRTADPELAVLAVDAARKWEFEAARRNDEPVSSSLVAHFRFRPPAQ
jgi:TonB family protein